MFKDSIGHSWCETDPKLAYRLVSSAVDILDLDTFTFCDAGAGPGRLLEEIASHPKCVSVTGIEFDSLVFLKLQETVNQINFKRKVMADALRQDVLETDYRPYDIIFSFGPDASVRKQLDALVCKHLQYNSAYIQMADYQSSHIKIITRIGGWR